MSQTKNKILLLGLGNDVLTDDAIGLHVVREVRRQLQGVEGLDIHETAEMGLALLDFIVGYREVIIVDAVQTQQAPPGSLHEVEGHELKALPALAPHFFGIGEILALGRALAMDIPSRVTILAVEVLDPLRVSTQLTPPVRDAFPHAVERTVAVIRHKMESAGSTL